METKTRFTNKFEIPDHFLNEFYSETLTSPFDPKYQNNPDGTENSSVSLIAIDLNQVLEWLLDHPFPRVIENEPCGTPVLLHVSNFSTKHILFYYDGTASSVYLIDHFLKLFKDLIKESKATIISPSFIPKSRLKEEEEVILKVSQATKETSFIKLNFSKIGDFWSYATKHKCTMLIVSKKHQSDLSKILFNFYSAGIWDENLSFYLSL